MRSRTERCLGVDAVLFDLDGTLVESTAALHSAFNEFAADFGVAADAAMVARFDGLSTYEIIERAAAEWRTRMPPEALQRRYFDRLARAYAGVMPAASAGEVLAALRARGRRLALVTSAACELANGLVDRLGWRQSFDAIVCGDAGRKGKPHPEPYLAVLERLALAANDAVAVEDSMNGVRSARAAGIRVIALAAPDRAADMAAAGATVTLRSLDELPGVLV